MSTHNHRIESLDILRFFAFMMVLCYHYLFIAPLQGFYPKSLYVEGFYFGDFGVDLFFVISGFVISLSSSGRTAFQFFKARFNRIVPTFFVCSVIVLLFNVSIPVVSFSERLEKFLYSMTFFPRFFGSDYLSAVYWTLNVEVTFYIWVFAFILLGAFDKYKSEVCLAWLSISIVNNGVIHSDFLSALMITKYCGHFVLGMVLFEIRVGFKPVHVVLGVLGASQMYFSMSGFESWVSGKYGPVMSGGAIIFSIAAILSLVWWVSTVERLSVNARIVQTLGAMSYPLYLVHADIGFWSHAIFEQRFFSDFPWLQELISYPVMIVLAVILSFVLAFLVVRVSDPIFYRLLSRLWGVFAKPKDSVVSRA